MPHVFEEDAILNMLSINVRQKTGSELPFVTLLNGADSTDAVIDATDVNPGVYSLVLDSFDFNNNTPALALTTDTITIVITKAEETLSNSIFELPTKILMVG